MKGGKSGRRAHSASSWVRWHALLPGSHRTWVAEVTPLEGLRPLDVRPTLHVFQPAPFVDVVRLCPEVCFHIFVFAGASFLRTVLSLALRVEKLLDQPLTMLRARSASRAASAMAARAPAAGAARLPLNFIQQRGMAGKDIKFGNDARALLLQVRLQHRAWGASMKARR